ncbi:MAG: hypothetical protein JWO57_434 [Pseudonocardiales bacterium]|nr:hypothetical protein [Pseudonocardiales bacterium]
MSTIESDRSAILKLHKDWWEANCGLDIPLMQTVFPANDAYLMFNLNGHPYFGIDEKTTLWEYYSTRINVGMSEVYIMRLDIGADMAYLCAEALFPRTQNSVAEDGTPLTIGATESAFGDVTRVRATEVYKRDDGSGEPRWTMWHFHCSPLPPGDEVRPSTTDTADERGLGFVPGHETISVVGK